MHKAVILHNIIAPYKTLLFNALYDIYHDFKVLYISRTEKIREWDVIEHDMKFPYEVMFDQPSDNVNPAVLFKETWAELEQINPELVIIGGYSYSSYWAGLTWAKIKKKKTILWSSSNRDDHERVFYKELMKKVFIRNCDLYNVYGTKSREYLQTLGAEGSNIHETGNTTDNDFYYRETEKWREKREELCREFGIPGKNFLYIGRFSEEKNIFSLLESYHIAGGLDNEWGVILLGSGPLESDITAYIRDHGIKNVYMPGYAQKDEVPKYMAVSDVLVLPSISEPWGLVVNEAMAAGMPVLVSEKSGCSVDLVREGENGFLFDPYDKERLSMLMKKFIVNKVDLKEMGSNSLKIISNYTPKNAAKVVGDTIEALI